MFLLCLPVCLSLSVCLSVCLSEYLRVCVSVRLVTFEADGIDTFFLAQW